MKLALRTALATAALLIASPALAGVTIDLGASTDNGILVHGTGTEVTAPEVIANLGSNGPNIVHFNGTTDDPATDDLRLQGGSGQADITGAEITLGGNPEGYDPSDDEHLPDRPYRHGLDRVRLDGRDGTNGGTVDFFITLNGSDGCRVPGPVLGSGDHALRLPGNWRRRDHQRLLLDRHPRVESTS
jgi:hypothetical protein